MRRFWTKATTRESGDPKMSVHWVTSRRAWFKVFADRVECGDWLIPVAEITDAILYRGKQFLIPISVLELRTEARTYQFGFNPWVNIRKNLPFEVEEKPVRITLSMFSLFLRLALLLYIVWWIWTGYL